MVTRLTDEQRNLLKTLNILTRKQVPAARIDAPAAQIAQTPPILALSVSASGDVR